MTRRWLRAAVAIGVASLPAAVRAQISPGPLSRAHAKLEGSGRCLECHDPAQGVAAGKCLACHKPLQERIAAGKGLHARPEYGDCKSCHVEHQGADVDLVWWGKKGREAFDHAQTGQPLVGKHAQLACERCHKPPRYVGLTTSCTSCHADEHRGQFGGRGCTNCHTQAAWKPASGFDHRQTRWPLTGRHAPVSCEKCHPTRRADPARPTATYRVFRVVSGRECASCHEDTHGGRLGRNCASCHSTAGWRGGQKTAFDHSRTAYPLAGRHSAVACEKCHPPGQRMHRKHDRCTDCHADPHEVTLAKRVDGGRCEGCHDTGGFRPARFGPEDHTKSAYPLVGAHLAVACDGCHRPAPKGRSGVALPLRFTSTRCADCHKDPHRGEADRFAARGGCETCHRVDSWRAVAFDHGQTPYPLAGRHARVACVGCHRGRQAGGAPGPLRFAAVPVACAICHRDPHGGQFVAQGRAASCERCHTTDSLQASKFDHSRDAAYALDGAHARLPCSACHRPEARAGVTFVRYKPLPTTCNGCHGQRRQLAHGGRP